MSLSVLEVAVWIFGIRGDPPGNSQSAIGRGYTLIGRNWLLRIMAIATGSIALLAITLWATVWLTIRLL
jgi:hypothetical protein